MAKQLPEFKTWIELDRNAIHHNIKTIRSLLKPKTQLFAVVKSNAYGHGLFEFSRAIKDKVDGFCVDSVIEGTRLRDEGITKPILVLGPTLPHMLEVAAAQDITIMISSFDWLSIYVRSKIRPKFELKFDTGMHRQGFFLSDIPQLLKIIRNSKLGIRNLLKGAYTHFASAKDLNYPTYTDEQFKNFLKVKAALTKAGFGKITFHAAASGGVLMDQKYHFDRVRVGMGLYGFFPSKELEIQMHRRISFHPVLSWHTIVTEIKHLKGGDYIGYDLAYRLRVPRKVAIIPIGYWHGLPWNLWQSGEVLVNGQYAKIVGRISMDLTIIDVTDIPCTFGDRVTMIGAQRGKTLWPQDLARAVGTSPYEIITRVNPLIKRTLGG